MPARLLAACSLLAVATLAPPFRAAGTPSAAAIVPFAFVDNRMTIECTIDGRGPFVMIVDTGAPDVAITPEAAKKLGLAVRDAGTTSGAGNNRAQNGATTIPLLSIGSLHLRNLDSGVIDLTEIQRKLGFARLDGIVGYAVLKQFATFIDADARTITFSSSLPSVPSGATTTRFSGSTPVIPARIDGIDTTVIVDTGDRSSLTLFGPFAKMHGYYGRDPSRTNIVTGYGLGGPVYGDVLTLPSLDVLGTHLSGVIARASRQTGGVFTDPDHGGSIGEGVLKRFNIVYDYRNHRIIAWRSRYFGVPDAFVAPGSGAR